MLPSGVSPRQTHPFKLPPFRRVCALYVGLGCTLDKYTIERALGGTIENSSLGAERGEGILKEVKACETRAEQDGANLPSGGAFA